MTPRSSEQRRSCVCSAGAAAESRAAEGNAGWEPASPSRDFPGKLQLSGFLGFLFKLAVLVNGGREAHSLSRQQAARAGRTHLSTEPGRASGGCSRPGVPRQQLRSSRAPRHSKPHAEKPRCFPGCLQGMEWGNTSPMSFGAFFLTHTTGSFSTSLAYLVLRASGRCLPLTQNKSSPNLTQKASP